MRIGGLACAVAIMLGGVAGCGGGNAQPRFAEDEANDDEGPFVAKAGFEPTAFTVDVRGSGVPVIFIPGLGCPGAVWEDAVDRLIEAVPGGIEAHIITLAGFAGVDAIKPPLAAKTRQQLVRYIRSRRLYRPVIVGHSMGGFITYWLGTTSSDALAGLVVVDAGPALGRSSDEQARLLRNVWAQAGDDELPVRVRTVFSGMVRAPAKIAPYLPLIAKSDREAIGDAIYEMVKTDLRGKLGAISVPTLLVLADGGLQSRYRGMAKGVRDLEVAVVPRTRHFVWLDDPASFARVVGLFIEEVTEVE